MSLSKIQLAVQRIGPKEFLRRLTPSQRVLVLYSFALLARPEQILPHTGWDTALALAGRGWGKTWMGAQWIRQCVRRGVRHIALIGRTYTDVRKVMVEGPAGILAVHTKYERPKYEPGNKQIIWRNGAVATCYSADKPDSLRGPAQQVAWADEPCTWRYVQDAWNNMLFGLRMRRADGAPPQVLATTTPRPIPWLKELIKQPGTHVTGGTTYENAVNLAERFLREILKRFEGTRLGRQEIYAILLDEIEGALWTHLLFETHRVGPENLPPMERIVVAIDPAMTAKKGSAETGIIVMGKGENEHGYLLEDLSGKWTTDEWAEKACWAYYKYEADAIVAEVNQGGDLVAKNISVADPDVNVLMVHAKRGKYKRAEPVAAMYEQGRFHHVGMFSEIEDQCTTFVPGSPDGTPSDRMDALVWGGHELFLDANSFLMA